MINLEWYRTFKAIYQNGTLTKAAQELLISQPNVSIQLSALESYMGQALFTRFPRKMVPTELGKQLYTQIIESIDNLERVESEFRKSEIKKIPHIRLGSPSELFVNYLASNISALNCSLEVSFGLAHDLISSLNNNSLDIAIITQKDKEDNLLTYDYLITESMMVVASDKFDSRVIDSYIESADIKEIEKWMKQQQWIAYNNNLAIIRRFWRENFNKRPLLRLKSVIPDNNAILAAVANSNILSVSSNLIAGKALREGLVKTLWEGVSPTSNDIYLAYNKSKIDIKYIQKIKSFILSNIIL